MKEGCQHRGPRRAFWIKFWSLVAGGALLDQLSKIVVFAAVPETAGRGRAVIPGFFYITHRNNPGMAWGLLSGLGAAGAPLLIGLNLIVVGLLAYMHVKNPSAGKRRWLDLAVGLILAGAAGNLLDRMKPPFMVRDFLQFVLFGWSYPAFNLADAFIVVGVGVYIVWAWLGEKRGKSPVGTQGQRR